MTIQYKMFNKGFAHLTLGLLTIMAVGCQKLVDVQPPTTSINGANVFNSDVTATAVLTGIYSKMSSSGFVNGGPSSIAFYGGLSSDELTLYSGSTNATYIGYYTNSLTNANTGNSDFWRSLYPTVFVANSAIAGITGSKGLTSAVKEQLLGEAKFIRAFCYFYLANLYGDVPLVLSTDYQVNASLSRTPQDKVYDQIIADLTEAQTLLSATYLDGNLNTYPANAERTRPTKAAATALLSRVYLYKGDWENAKSQATDVINYNGTYDTVSLNNVFAKTSKEAIWQLQPVNLGWNTEDARFFILTGAPTGSRPVYLSAFLLNAFEPGDKRRSNWVGAITVGATTYQYLYKYKSATQGNSVTEYEIVLRLGEQFLIRAEAKAQLNDLNGALSDVNIIRARAGLPDLVLTDKTEILNKIMHERQVELFGEWGHRWLDMKRTGTADAVMSAIAMQKGASWQTTDQLYPISLSELTKGPQLVQNLGY